MPEVKRRQDYDAREHPRDRLGRFIEVGSSVRLRGGGTGVVVGPGNNGRILVRRNDTGKHVPVDTGSVTVTARPSGAQPTSRSEDHPAKITDAPEVAAPEPVASATPFVPEVGQTVSMQKNGKHQRNARVLAVDEAASVAQVELVNPGGTQYGNVRGVKTNVPLADLAPSKNEKAPGATAEQRMAARDVEFGKKKPTVDALAVPSPANAGDGAPGRGPINIGEAEIGDRISYGGEVHQVVDVEYRGDVDNPIAILHTTTTGADRRKISSTETGVVEHVGREAERVDDVDPSKDTVDLTDSELMVLISRARSAGNEEVEQRLTAEQIRRSGEPEAPDVAAPDVAPAPAEAATEPTVRELYDDRQLVEGRLSRMAEDAEVPGGFGYTVDELIDQYEDRVRDDLINHPGKDVFIGVPGYTEVRVPGRLARDILGMPPVAKAGPRYDADIQDALDRGDIAHRRADRVQAQRAAGVPGPAPVAAAPAPAPPGEVVDTRRTYTTSPSQVEVGDSMVAASNGRGLGGEWEIEEIVERTDIATVVRLGNFGQRTLINDEPIRIARAADRPEPAPYVKPERPKPQVDVPANERTDYNRNFRYPANVTNRAAFGTPDGEGRITGESSEKNGGVSGYLARDPRLGRFFLVADPRTEPGEDGGLYPDLSTGTPHRFNPETQEWEPIARRPREGLAVVRDAPEDGDPILSFDYSDEDIAKLGALVKPWTSPDGRVTRHYINNWPKLTQGLVTVSRGRRGYGGRQYEDDTYQVGGLYPTRDVQEELRHGRVYIENGRLQLTSGPSYVAGPALLNGMHTLMDRPERVAYNDDGQLMVTEAPPPPPPMIKATNKVIKDLDKELTDQGLDDMHPMRGVLNNRYGNHVIVARSDDGRIIGGIQASVDGTGRNRSVRVVQMRVLPEAQRQGIGQQMIRSAALEVGDNGDLTVGGAVSDAKPFYARTGAVFHNHETSSGTWTADAVNAMKRGEDPPRGSAPSEWEYRVQEARELRQRYPQSYREHYGDVEPEQAVGPGLRGDPNALVKETAADDLFVNAPESTPEILSTAQPVLTASDVETGVPVELPWAHRRQQTGNFGATYGQDIEPAGRYLSVREPGDAFEGQPGVTTGVANFESPLVMEFGGGYADEDNWKRVLSAKYGGKKGSALSQAVRNDGYDVIITRDKYGFSEVVDLTSYTPKKTRTPKVSRQVVRRGADAPQSVSLRARRAVIKDMETTPAPDERPELVEDEDLESYFRTPDGSAEAWEAYGPDFSLAGYYRTVAGDPSTTVVFDVGDDFARVVNELAMVEQQRPSMADLSRRPTPMDVPLFDIKRRLGVVVIEGKSFIRAVETKVAAAPPVEEAPPVVEDDPTTAEPRDRRGRVVEIGGTVSLPGGGAGTVQRSVEGGRIEVLRSDSKKVTVEAATVTMIRSAAANQGKQGHEVAANAAVEEDALAIIEDAVQNLDRGFSLLGKGTPDGPPPKKDAPPPAEKPAAVPEPAT